MNIIQQRYIYLRVSIRKIFATEYATFCFRYFKCLREKYALCAIIRKLNFAQNCAFPLSRYFVLRNFAEEIITKRYRNLMTLGCLYLTKTMILQLFAFDLK